MRTTIRAILFCLAHALPVRTGGITENGGARAPDADDESPRPGRMPDQRTTQGSNVVSETSLAPSGMVVTMRWGCSLLLGTVLFHTGLIRAEEILCTDGSRLDLRNGRAEITSYRGVPAWKLTEIDTGRGGAFAMIRDLSFHNGTIDLEVSGAPAKTAEGFARGFIGIVFRMQGDGSHFESIYIRPTNGRADDQLRRNHATQYVSSPDWPWERLRKESPGAYESYADLVPGEWTPLRIVVNGTRASLYVGNASQPCLIVRDLKLGDCEGAIGLWIGPGTEGYFRRLTISGESEKSPPYGSNAKAGHYLDNGGTRIYYESYGEGGRPLVLLHGGLYGYIEEFGAIIDRMRKDRKVIAIATRGHGLADLGNQPFSYALFADDAAKVIEHETKDKVDLLGFSQGAITSFVLASSRPELVHRLVAIGGSLGPSGATKQAMDTYQKLNAADMAKDLVRDAPGFVARRKKLMPSPERWDEFLGRLAKLWSTPVYVTPAQIQSIQCPTLVVAGDQDPYVRGDHLLEIGRLLRQGQVALIPGCGHVVFDSKPDLMINITTTFLREANR
jgi:pimeloyl-ACP methyl ester carboxylesterase